MPIDPDPLAVPRPSDAATPLAGSSTAGAGGPDGLHALPSWLRRAVQAWGVRRSDSSWVGGVLAGVAERYRVDPLLARGVFVALCVVSAGFGLLAYAVAWALLPDGDGTVHYGRLRRGEWQDATVAIAVIGGIGVLNVVLGAGFTLLAPVVGGPGSLLGLAAVAVLVWWLVTRWDGSTQSRVGPAPASEPEASGRAAARPAWYLRRDDARAAASRQDAHGFRADWLDPETGTWRSPVHSRELRAAARLAEEEQAAPAGPSGRGSAVVAAPRRLSPAVQAVTYAVAALAAAAAVGASLLVGVGSLTLLAVPAIVAALAVIAPVMLAALLTGRRPGSLAPASGILVGAAALQVAVAVAVL